MNAVVIAGVELRRFLRDRSNIFFVFIFPLLLVMLIGAQFGDQSVRGQALVVGAGSELRTALVERLEQRSMEVDRADRTTALQQVARNRADVAVIVGSAAARAYDEGQPVSLEVVPSSQATSQMAVQEVRLAVDSLGAAQGQLVALTDLGVPRAAAEGALQDARAALEVPTIEVESVDELAQEFEGLGRFDFGASGQLLLFVFLSTLAGGATLIQARRLGVVARTLASPVTTRQLMLGEALGRFAIALFQGVYIMVMTALLFDVSWGNLGVAVVILALFSLVAAGAAMLIGALMDNEGAASGVSIGAGLVLAALGGSMMPLELFPAGMRLVANATPHAWAYEAFAEVQRHGGGLVDVLPELGVLAAMAVLLLALGTWALRRSLARAL